MPLWNLTNIEIYNHRLTDGLKYIQTQISTVKKIYTPHTPITPHLPKMTKIQSDSPTKTHLNTPKSKSQSESQSELSDIEGILDQLDKQEQCEEIKELQNLPNLFSVNFNNSLLEKIEVTKELCNPIELDDSDISFLSDFELPIQTPALVDRYSYHTPEQKNNVYYSSPTDAAFPELPWNTLLCGLTGVDTNIILAQNGYKKVRKIADTLQGEIIEAIKTEQPSMHVSIKITNKKLWKQRISMPDCDGFKNCIEDDICKERVILKHLTTDNASSGGYIAKYLDFFESENDYFLVTEYIKECKNLKQFIKQSFRYIKDGRLELREYQHFVRYVMWQLCALIHWLHNDMHCCHLGLTTENVLLNHATFMEKAGDKGKLSVNPNISIKLSDFGKSEIFKDSFECQKPGLFLDDIQYLAPNIYDGEVYKANKADLWAVGMIIFECLCGKPLYQKRIFDSKKKIGTGFWALENKKLETYLKVNDLQRYVSNAKILSLLNGVLETNESDRLNALEVIRHSYFKSYYQSYKTKIIKKSVTQKKRLRRQSEKMERFIYYSYAFPA